MLTEPEKTFLNRLAARAKTEQRLALRAKILLALDSFGFCCIAPGNDR